MFNFCRFPVDILDGVREVMYPQIFFDDILFTITRHILLLKTVCSGKFKIENNKMNDLVSKTILAKMAVILIFF